MNTAAFELGRQSGLKGGGLSKKQRKALIADAGLNVCECCEDFEAGRNAGIKEREEIERPAREAKKAEIEASKARVQKLIDVTPKQDHRGESLMDFAARKRREHLNMDGPSDAEKEAWDEFMKSGTGS